MATKNNKLIFEFLKKINNSQAFIKVFFNL